MQASRLATESASIASNIRLFPLSVTAYLVSGVRGPPTQLTVVESKNRGSGFGT